MKGGEQPSRRAPTVVSGKPECSSRVPGPWAPGGGEKERKKKKSCAPRVRLVGPRSNSTRTTADENEGAHPFPTHRGQTWPGPSKEKGEKGKKRRNSPYLLRASAVHHFKTASTAPPAAKRKEKKRSSAWAPPFTDSTTFCVPAAAHPSAEMFQDSRVRPTPSRR